MADGGGEAAGVRGGEVWQETMVHSKLPTCEEDEEMMERTRECGKRSRRRGGVMEGGGM